MTVHELLTWCYHWADLHAFPLLLGATAWPVLGTLLAAAAKRLRAGTDGRVIASALIGVAVLAAFLESAAISVAVGVLHQSLLEANALLLLTPVVCLVGSFLGVRLIYPLSELGSVQTLGDVALFAVVCSGVVWFLSRFHGWGVLFLGSFRHLVMLGVLALFILGRLLRRAFGASARIPVDEG